MGKTRAALAAAALLIASGCAAPPPPTPREQVFIAAVSRTLVAKYPTMKSAEADGYMPLTGKLDGQNTYNLSDMDFVHVSPDHPNFLWYDRRGRVVGADFEVPKSAYPKPPDTYPVNASRWAGIDEHVHLSYTLNGQTVYEEESAEANLRTGRITPAELRTDGFLPKGAVLRWAMYHPAVWDLALWVVPNPSGAFAGANPLVK